MSDQNKTSQAVDFLLNQRSSSPEAGVMMAKKETFKAIVEKYKRYEDALIYMRKEIRGDGTVVVTKEFLDSLIYFDPLAALPATPSDR